MRKTGYSSWRFFSSNLLSRALLPFNTLLFSNFQYVLTDGHATGPLQGWVFIGLSIVFFYVLYIQILRKETNRFSRGDLWSIGFIWSALAVMSQLAVLYGLRNKDLGFILSLYSVTSLQPWLLSLIGLLISPRLAAIVAKKWFF